MTEISITEETLSVTFSTNETSPSVITNESTSMHYHPNVSK